MLKGHPKGLLVLSFTNMGERFGYYTMLAIFVLYLQAKFGYTAETASTIYGTFLAFVYFLPLLGGILADKWLGYGKTILLGIFVMLIGYFLLSLPTETTSTGEIMLFASLGMISLGTGFFKGNLQALVGNLYDKQEYSQKRDIAFSIFYMCINIGAFFAPSAAEAVSNFFLKADGFFYDARIPALAHQLMNGTLVDTAIFAELAKAQNFTGELSVFATEYIASLSKAYNYGFGVACISLVFSIGIFLAFRNTYKEADITETEKAKDKSRASEVIELTPEQTRQRLTALGLVFVVVIFFWMSFHQNGLTMTFFARDYTQSMVMGFERIWFSLTMMIPIAATFFGILLAVKPKTESKKRMYGVGLAVVGAAVMAYFYGQLPEEMSITPQIFQQFNPFFIVLLTPIFVGLFAWLNKNKIEPSAPKKIGIGMIIAAIGFIILFFGSLGLQAPRELVDAGGVSPSLISPYWLMNTYFVLTIAELFLSPMGISFVSKVSPPKYKGLMQGGWLAATAIGNYLVQVIGFIWMQLPVWAVWGVLVVCCLLSAAFIFSIMKRLERAANS